MTVFEAPQNEEAPKNDASPLNDLVGEDKKFATVEDLAKGKAEADQFIEQLKGEISGLREDLDKRLTSEQVLEEIQRQKAEASRNEGNTNSQNSAEDISEIVKQVINGEKAAETAEANLATANNKMVEIYGVDKAKEVVAAKAAELGVGIDFLQDVAAKSPAAFFNTIGLEGKPASVPAANAEGSVNTEGLAQNGTGTKEGSWEHFEQLRKENPREYWSASTQKKLFELKKAGAI